MATTLKTYGYHVLIGVDQLINALLGGFADETLSSRTYRKAVLKPKPCKKWRLTYRLIEAIFFWERGKHCQIAYESERKRKQLPKELRTKVERDKATNFLNTVEKDG